MIVGVVPGLLRRRRGGGPRGRDRRGSGVGRRRGRGRRRRGRGRDAAVEHVGERVEQSVGTAAVA